MTRVIFSYPTIMIKSTEVREMKIKENVGLSNGKVYEILA